MPRSLHFGQTCCRQTCYTHSLCVCVWSQPFLAFQTKWSIAPGPIQNRHIRIFTFRPSVCWFAISRYQGKAVWNLECGWSWGQPIHYFEGNKICNPHQSLRNFFPEKGLKIYFFFFIFFAPPANIINGHPLTAEITTSKNDNFYEKHVYFGHNIMARASRKYVLWKLRIDLTFPGMFLQSNT